MVAVVVVLVLMVAVVVLVLMVTVVLAGMELLTVGRAMIGCCIARAWPRAHCVKRLGRSSSCASTSLLCAPASLLCASASLLCASTSLLSLYSCLTPVFVQLPHSCVCLSASDLHPLQPHAYA